MPDAKNFRIMTDANCKSFLQIEKSPSGSYIIRFFPQSITYDFISIVVEMLQEYGDVFAAYVNTLNPDLPLVENKYLITIFPTTIEETKVIVAKTDESYPETKHQFFGCWKSSEVNYLEGLSKFTVYDGHLYVFTKECNGQPNDTPKSPESDYDTKSLRQLKEIAKERKIHGYALMKRNEIIKALRESE